MSEERRNERMKIKMELKLVDVVVSILFVPFRSIYFLVSKIIHSLVATVVAYVIHTKLEHFLVWFVLHCSIHVSIAQTTNTHKWLNVTFESLLPFLSSRVTNWIFHSGKHTKKGSSHRSKELRMFIEAEIVTQDVYFSWQKDVYSVHRVPDHVKFDAPNNSTFSQ